MSNVIRLFLMALVVAALFLPAGAHAAAANPKSKAPMADANKTASKSKMGSMAPKTVVLAVEGMT
jgi:hypothetical protein